MRESLNRYYSPFSRPHLLRKYFVAYPSPLDSASPLRPPKLVSAARTANEIKLFKVVNVFGPVNGLMEDRLLTKVAKIIRHRLFILI